MLFFIALLGFCQSMYLPNGAGYGQPTGYGQQTFDMSGAIQKATENMTPAEKMQLQQKTEWMKRMVEAIRIKCMQGGVTGSNFDAYGLDQLPALRECVKSIKLQYNYVSPAQELKQKQRGAVLDSFMRQEMNVAPTAPPIAPPVVPAQPVQAMNINPQLGSYGGSYGSTNQNLQNQYGNRTPYRYTSQYGQQPYINQPSYTQSGYGMHSNSYNNPYVQRPTNVQPTYNRPFFG